MGPDLRQREEERLVVCPQCGCDTVCPVTWAAVDDTSWTVWMRCGSCGAWRHGVFSDDLIYQFDEDLDVHQCMIEDALARITRERAEDDLKLLCAALAADAILPGDFAY